MPLGLTVGFVMLVVADDQCDRHARINEKVGLATSGRHREERERPRRRVSYQMPG